VSPTAFRVACFRSLRLRCRERAEAPKEECPTLPPTTEERIIDNRAQTVADTVMYREALATAAEARGWSVHWYDRERVFRDAAAVLGRADIDAFLSAMGRSIEPPWQAKHKLAAAAALAVAGIPQRRKG